jgi:hypothetical protein
MRSLQPPDVAGQALRELDQLAYELNALPARLASGGLTRIHQRNYCQITLAYLGLAENAWQAIAEERLEQSAAETEYRRQALGIAQQITQLQRESRMAADNEQFRLSRRRPPFWRQRAQLTHMGLSAFTASVSAPADPLRMGQGLFQLRGYIGLANASRLELGLLGVVLRGVGASGAFLILGLLLLLAPAVAAGQVSIVAGLTLAALLVALLWMLAEVLAFASRAPLRLLLGATLYTPARTVRLGKPGAALPARLLRGWSLLVLVAGALGLAAALIVQALYVRAHLPATAPKDALEWAHLMGSALVVIAAPAGAVCLAALVLLALPLFLVAQGRLSADLRRNPTWVPAARRSGLRATMSVLAVVSGALLVAVYLGSSALGLGPRSNTALVTLAGPAAGTITWRAVALLLALALPYLLLVELPYRQGIRTWRQLWLSDLITRRAGLESQLRLLSAPDPRTGAQNTSEENLRAMQYDLVLLQFYRSKIEEAQRVPAAPFSARNVITLAVGAVVVAVVIDYAAPLLAHVLANLR